MFPLPMFATIPKDLETIDSRHALPYHLAFMKNTILRGLNNINTLARELRRDDPRLGAFLQYITGYCDVLVLHINMDERLFRAPVITDTSLVKVLGEGCVQDMRRVVQNAEKLKSLAQMFAQHPAKYNGSEIIEHLAFGNEFAARSWTQLHSIDVRRLESAYSETEMRCGLLEVIDAFVDQSDVAFLIPFIHSHHDRNTSSKWPKMSPEGRIILPCLAKTYARSWELAPYDISTGRERRSRETRFSMYPSSNEDISKY